MADNALYQPRIDGEMRATQPRNALLGLLADALYAADKFAQRPNPSMPMGKANPPLSLLSSALGLGDIAATADRLNMRQDLTRGSGWATQMLPETANALLSVGPAVAKYPKQAAVAMGLLSGDTNAAMKAATVWHGSPHKFDKFDSSKIGTGEGAQAYGHGLYLAESPDVSKTYMRTQLGNAPELEQMALRAGVSKDAANTLASWYHQTKDTNGLDKFLDLMRTPAPSPYIQKFRDSVVAEEPALRKAWQSFADPGNLYKVDLPDSAISRMLDWDKPLSQQAPEVQRAISPMFGPTAAEMTGQDIYKKAAGFDSMVNVASKTGGNAATLKTIFPQASEAQIQQAIAAAKNAGSNDRMAAQMLRDAGIPGIRYLDGGSRGAGAGTSNFVVFPGEENMLSILERNGVPLK